MSTDLDKLAHTPAQHFRLVLFGVIARMAGHCTAGGTAAALAAHPFLGDYQAEIAPPVQAAAGAPWCTWRERVAAWEARSEAHLPLRALRAAGLGELDLELLLAAGLVEEDPRFGQLFDDGGGRERRPAFGQLLAWWREGDDGVDRAEAVRRSLLELIRSGLLLVLNPDAPRPDWLLSVPHAVWDGLRGDPPALRWLRCVPRARLCPLDSQIASADTVARAAALPALLRAQPEPVLVVRGPRHNGRKTLIGGVAHALGRSLLVAQEAAVLDEEPRWRLFGLLAVLLNAVPVVDCELTPGESRVLAALPFGGGPLCVVTGRHGAWSSAEARPMLTLELPLPDAAQRELHWRAVLPQHDPAVLAELARAARLTSGNVRRVAQSAAALAALAQRDAISIDDVQQVCRTLQSARLETLATRLPGRGGLHELAVDSPTRDEMEALAVRCRFREQLAASGAAVSQGNAGVRALLAGNSGTGKTLAARLLAGTLGKDLYRIDLSAIVNKYLGETEKNLHRAFAAAEELDAMLLLDEGDALMAGRTQVASSNDRYANLETNYLLQRIEFFDGILLVTTNAADRIDRAFSRRMDVVVHFRPPDEWRRYDILKLHLAGAGDDIDDDWLQQIACRCTLTGGQLRNVVSHAQLLALQQRRGMRTEHLYVSLQREYRKTGATCPLRPAGPAAAVPTMP